MTMPSPAAPGEEAAGQPADSSYYRLEEILVQAPRPIATAGGASAIEAQIEKMGVPAAPTLEQVFRQLPLLHIRTNSRGEAEISARGSESRQVAVLVDGVPITLAWDARADISVVPATAIKEILFIRGASSMLYGPNALGGVVEAGVGRSVEQPRAASVRLAGGFDDVGSTGWAATAELPYENAGGSWLFRGGLGYRDTPGQPLAKGVIEPHPDGDGLRINTDARSLDGFLTARFRGKGGAWCSFTGSAFRESRGIAPELGLPEEDARFWRYPHLSRALAIASAGTGERGSPLGGRGGLEASFAYDRGRTEVDSYPSHEYDEVESFEYGRDRTLTTRLLGEQTLGRRGDLRGAFTLAEIRHEETLGEIDAGETATEEAVYRQRLWSFGGESKWHLLQGAGWPSLTASVGGAYDLADTPESGGREPLGRISEWGARAGFTLGLAGGRTTVHAGVGRRGRFPALRELYSGALNRFAPNPDLRPEKLVATEVGVTNRMGRGMVQAVGFYHHLKDAVVRITLEDRRFMRVNRDELDSVGLEILSSYALSFVTLSGNLMLQQVKLTDTDAEQTHRPENLPEAAGGIDATFRLPLGIEAGGMFDYTGEQFAIEPGSGEDSQLDRRTIIGGFIARSWSLGGSRRPFTRFESRVSVDNATDAALYDAVGLPEPGRRFRLEFRLS